MVDFILINSTDKKYLLEIYFLRIFILLFDIIIKKIFKYEQYKIVVTRLYIKCHYIITSGLDKKIIF